MVKMTVRYYVRVSSMDQKIDRQLLAYDKADFIYIDKMSGIKRRLKKLYKHCIIKMEELGQYSR